MRRSYIWTMLCVLAVIVAPLATQFALPVGVARAEPDAPAALHHDEVVTLSPSGQIIVTDVFPQPGMVPANCPSAANANCPSTADDGWQYIAAGDFRGDGYEQIVAIGGGRLKVFDPFAAQAGKTPVTFERTLTNFGTYELITTGDFNRDGKDDIAATASWYNPGYSDNLWVYNVSTNTTMYSESFAAPWQAATTGDFNNDGADDLAMVRNPAGNSPYLKVWNGLNWSTIAEQAFGYPWITLEAGRLASTSLPDQLALLRTGVGADLDSLLMFNVYSGGFSDVFPGQNGQWRYSPNFTSLALADLTGAKQDVMYLLRDSVDAGKVSLLQVNPANVPVPGHEIALETGYYSWKQVRAGDVNGDGRDEIVILRSDRFRVYPQLWQNESFREFPGSYRIQLTGTDWPVMVLANLDGPGVPSAPTLSVLPTSLSYKVNWGDPGTQKALAIENTGVGTIAWTAQVTQGSPWLNLGSTFGTTPGTLFVSVNSVAAGVGTHTGNIRITATTPGTLNSPQDIPVTLTVPDSGFLVYPTQMTLWQQIGAATVTRQVEILRPNIPTGWVATALPMSAAAGLEEKLANGEAKVTENGVMIDGIQVPPPAWLSFTPDSGTTRTVMTVNVTPGTSPGTYRGAIVVVAQDPTALNPVQSVIVTAVVANQFNYNYLPLVAK
jgi:hypothetical protein